MKQVISLLVALFVFVLLFGTESETKAENTTADNKLICRTAGAKHPSGVWAQIDFRGKWQRNTGGILNGIPGKGSGLCVFSSFAMGSDWHSENEIAAEFQTWMTFKEGGGWPKKLDDMVTAFCSEKGLTKPDFIQDQSGSLDLLVKACNAGCMPGVRYLWSPTGGYRGQRIDHMVNLVAARVGPNKLWAIMDNNEVGKPGDYEWFPEDVFKAKVFGNWSFVILKAGPPPVPQNSKKG